jgi:hypothetical protein
MLGIYMKRSVDRIDYDIDFSRWLPYGDAIQSATASVVSDDSMVSVPQVLFDGDTVKVWVTDGVSGKTATILVTATTNQNRIKQVEFQIRVKD